MLPGWGRNKFDAEFEELLRFLHERVQAFDRAGKGGGKRAGPVQSTKVSGGAAFPPEEEDPFAPTGDDDSLMAAAVADSRRPAPQQVQGGFRPTHCPQCQGKDHTYLSKCPQFIRMDARERHAVVKQLNACFNCLAQGHRIGACKSTYACRTCKKKNHHTLLHRQTPAGSAIAALEDVPTAGAGAAMVDQVDGTWAPPTRKDQVLAEGARAPDGCADPGGNACSIAKVPKWSVVFLCTIEIPVVNACGGTTTLRAMLDTGSQVDIITKAAADKLGWELAGQQLSIRGVGVERLRTRMGPSTARSFSRVESGTSCHAMSLTISSGTWPP